MGGRISIVCGEFHRDEVETMLEAAEQAAAENELEVSEVVWVPGSMETPLALQRVLDEVDGAVALGIIERGETQHGLAMGQAVSKAIIDLQLSTGKPIGLGIIGPGAEPSHIPPRLVPHARAAVEAVARMLQ